MKNLFLGILLLIGIFTRVPAGIADDAWQKMSVAELKANAARLHPAALYALAQRLFSQGEKDDAVFWFYAGQLRYRFLLKSSPQLDPSGEPALFASLSEVIGPKINEYAFGDIPKLVQTIDQVLDWDDKNPNAITSKKDNHEAWQQVRDGLGSLQDELRNEKDQIMLQRTLHGLQNRN